MKSRFLCFFLGMNYLIDDIRKATEMILSRVPLQQMLDVNDVIWYCSEIRHHIEKKRHHLGENHHPLLKYVRSSSFPRRATQPTTTTTASSNYSFSNVMSTVERRVCVSLFLVSSMIVLGEFSVNFATTFTIAGLQSSTTIRDGMYWNDWKVGDRSMDRFDSIGSSATFQRVLGQIIDQSFSNVFDEFAREMVKAPEQSR